MQPRHIEAGILRDDELGDMASRSSGAVSITRAFGGQSAMISRGTSDPANRHTGQRATRFCPRTVIRSGAPGPAPMKCTVMAWHLL